MRVASVKFDPLGKVFRLKNGKRLEAHRFCCLGPGDDVSVSKRNEVYARCVNGHAIVLPPYSARDRIQIGSRTVPLRIKEPVSKDEIEGYHKLEEYHYRGKVLHGRRVPLVHGLPIREPKREVKLGDTFGWCRPWVRMTLVDTKVELKF